MKVAKRLKAVYILQGKNAIPISENIFQFKLQARYKKQNKLIRSGRQKVASQNSSDLQEIETKTF